MEHGLYVHIPFCTRKCHYCDFNSYAGSQGAIERFVDALGREAALLAPVYAEVRFTTVFIGGGTPSLLAPSAFKAVIDAVRTSFSIEDGAEITVEANPGSLDADKLEGMRALGVNRLSIGVQSFDDTLLARIGRLHTADQAAQAFEAARRAGFDNVNVDLMFGLPGQEVETWAATLERAIELSPDHLSCYHLIVEEGTPFGELRDRGRLRLPGEDAESEMFEHTRERLNQAGYAAYEVSNFARPLRRCRHNMIYWRNEAWLGLGPGAWSQGSGRRWMNERLPSVYADRLDAGERPIAEVEHIAETTRMDETMMLGLRLMEGVDELRFEARFGLTLDEAYPGVIERLAHLGLLTRTKGRVGLTERGVSLANQVFAAFLRG